MMTAHKVMSALALALLVQLNHQARPAEGLNPAPPLRPLAPDASSLFAECSNIQSMFPPPNFYACYRTTIKQNGHLQTCEAKHLRAGQISIVSSNENYTIMMVHTPGCLLSSNYINRLLCRWDIRCPENQLMYFDMAELHIEPQRRSPLFQREVCVDYLKQYRDNGMKMTCGNRRNYTDLEPRHLRLEFRSNDRLQYPGFKLRIACFNPNLQDTQGCSQKNFPIHSIAQQRERGKRRTLTKPSLHTLTEVQQMFIAQDSTLLYSSSRIEITQSESVTFTIKEIHSFHTYNGLDGLVSYYSNRMQDVVLRGGGLLTIQHGSGVAYYYLYGVDPKFKPTQKQRDIINKILEAEEAQVVDNDFILEEEDAIAISDIARDRDTTTATPDIIPDHPPVAANKDAFEPDVINAALSGANSCNAVLRAVSASILDLIN